MARNEGDGIAWDRERIGEQPQDGLVCATALGSLGDAHLPRVTVPPDDGGAPRSGAHAQP